MHYFKLLRVIVFCFFCGGALFAADSSVVTDESDSIYGKGVHAFFDRHYEETVTILSKAEELKSSDPRPYYFLGLAYLRQKQTGQADRYFKKAAQLEYGGRAARDYVVSESLRRIQGEERLRIEKIRTEERSNARLREQRIQEARYGSENAAAREELRQSVLPNQKENLAALRQTAEDFDENAFGLQPVDPIATTEESIIARKTDNNPFGEVTLNVSEEPKVLVPAPSLGTPQNREPAAGTGRTFVNTNVSTAERTTSANQPASGSGITQNVQSTAKGIGRALGTLFSKQRN
jgi:hypothetical protein